MIEIKNLPQEQKRIVADALLVWSRDPNKVPNPDYGICSNLGERLGSGYSHVMVSDEYVDGWEFFSGAYGYPIMAPNEWVLPKALVEPDYDEEDIKWLRAMGFYDVALARPELMWFEGVYAQRRRELCERVSSLIG